MGSDNRNSYPPMHVLIVMLRLALVEIRASEDISMSKNLADMFHILPSQLLKEWDDEAAKNAFNGILKRARRCGMEQYILELKGAAERALNE